MKKADGIEKYIGCRWTGVSIHSDSLPPGGRIKGKMSLCQAVAESFNKRTVLSIENIDCAGARRSLGLTDNDEILARNISEKTGVSFPAARKALRSVPRFDRPITGLTLGKQPKPDMILCFVPPEKAMALLRRWQEVHGEKAQRLSFPLSFHCAEVLLRLPFKKFKSVYLAAALFPGKKASFRVIR